MGNSNAVLVPPPHEASAIGTWESPLPAEEEPQTRDRSVNAPVATGRAHHGIYGQFTAVPAPQERFGLEKKADVAPAKKDEP